MKRIDRWVATILSIGACGDGPPVGYVNDIGMELAWIPAGTFEMGAPVSSDLRSDYERQRQVHLTRGFYLSTTETTQAQWQSIQGVSPSYHRGDDLPVEQVSWFDAVNFCNALSVSEGLDPAYRVDGDQVLWIEGSPGYRLPSEAEWEYAAKTGNPDAPWVNNELRYEEGLDLRPAVDTPIMKSLRRVAWFAETSGPTAPHPVAMLEPDGWGLYDMHGNAWEWVWDRFGAYPDTESRDPTGPEVGSFRVKRGGSVFNVAPDCRAASRFMNAQGFRSTYNSFRVARSEPVVSSQPIDEATSYESEVAGNPRATPRESTASVAFRNPLGMTFSRMRAGAFAMGSPNDEKGRALEFDGPHDLAEEVHPVVLSRDVLVATTEVTQAQWRSVLGPARTRFVGDDLPMDSVPWTEAIRFCNELSHLEGLEPAYGFEGNDVTWNRDAAGYRLPTEAEWECAARAGTSSRFWSGNNDSDLDAVGWSVTNSAGRTHPVATKPANPLGLYDVHGNVSEWCWDRPSRWGPETVHDPVGDGTSRARIIRGGAWGFARNQCRSAIRRRLSGNNRGEVYAEAGLRPVRWAD